ncbi:MAG: hypothetical protein Q9M25_01630, partial [Mariprofundaceae bacterium]|nr:hypothetical protein [Mariprofundaceae bacterium]
AELEAGFVSFDDALQISTDEEHPEIRTIFWEGSNPEQLTEWINAFVAMSLQYVKKQHVSDEKLNKKQRELSLKQKLDGQLRIARQQRQDSILQLKDALTIAKKLNVKENSPLSGTQDKRQKKVDILLAAQPLYMRGSKALQAELEILQTRKDDAPYFPKIRSLQNQLKQLDTLHINPEKIRVARIDKPAFVPQSPFKPQRKIIVLSALFSGLILGIFIAFISAATTRARQEP